MIAYRMKGGGFTRSLENVGSVFKLTHVLWAYVNSVSVIQYNEHHQGEFNAGQEAVLRDAA